MSAASDLIERLEIETGQRIDDNNGDNLAMAGLFGALSRTMGQHQFDERDDVAAGLLIRHRMSQAYQSELESKKFLANLLASGISPDALMYLTGR